MQPYNLSPVMSSFEFMCDSIVFHLRLYAPYCRSQPQSLLQCVLLFSVAADIKTAF